jgi:hypothetical protein
MYDFYHEELLTESKNFQPREDNSFFEIVLEQVRQ